MPVMAPGCWRLGLAPRSGFAGDLIDEGGEFFLGAVAEADEETVDERDRPPRLPGDVGDTVDNPAAGWIRVDGVFAAVPPAALHNDVMPGVIDLYVAVLAARGLSRPISSEATASGAA